MSETTIPENAGNSLAAKLTSIAQIGPLATPAKAQNNNDNIGV